MATKTEDEDEKKRRRRTRSTERVTWVHPNAPPGPLETVGVARMALRLGVAGAMELPPLARR